MKKYNNGDYFGIVGDYSGLVYINGKWIKYQCGGCMRALGLLKNRLSNGDNPKLISMFQNRKFEYYHDAQLHNAWFKNNKQQVK